LEIESQNFEEINTAKLSIGEGEGVLLIIWDYFHDVFIKHLLDDASQVIIFECILRNCDPQHLLCSMSFFLTFINVCIPLHNIITFLPSTRFAPQFPFWASKLIVTSQPVKFGMPVIRAYWQCLQNVYFTRGVRGMFEVIGIYLLCIVRSDTHHPTYTAYIYTTHTIHTTHTTLPQGSLPYMFASCYHNHRFLTKVTLAFISNVL